MLAGEVFMMNLYEASKKNEDGHISQKDFREAEKAFLKDVGFPQLNDGTIDKIVEQTEAEREEFRSKFFKFPKVGV